MTSDNLLHKIYMASRTGVSRVLSRMVPPNEVEDIVQETYVRICQIENKERILTPKSFIFKTARNLALDYLKQANTKLVDRIDDPAILEQMSLDEEVDELYERALIDREFSQFCNAVRQLPLQCRRVFVLRKVYGCSQKEIAAKLSISESTVEKHIAKGMKQCFIYMNQHSINKGTAASPVPTENRAKK